MAESSPWSLIDVAKYGLKGFASGKVSLQDATAQARQMGLIDDQGNSKLPASLSGQGEENAPPASPLAMGVDPNPDQGPLSMLSPGRSPAAAPPAPNQPGGANFRGPLQPAQQSQALSALTAALKPQAAPDPDSPAGLAATLPINTGVKGMGGKAEVDSRDLNKISTTRLRRQTPDENMVDYDTARGFNHPITGYQPKVLPNGEPMIDAHGKPVLDQDQPIYDMTTGTQDPNNAIYKQQQGLDSMKGLLGLQAQANAKRSTMDWTPLAALADQWTQRNGAPSNLAASATKPTDTATPFFNAADELQKRQADIQKAIADSVKNQKDGSIQSQYLADLAAKNAASITPVKGASQEQQQFLNRVTHDASKLRDRDEIVANLSNMLSSWNPTSDKGIPVILTRALEGARPQLAAIAADSGDPSLGQKWDSLIERAGSGQMTANQRGEYKQQIQQMLQVHRDAANAMRASWGAQNQLLQNPIPDSYLQPIMGMATPSSSRASTQLSGIANSPSVGMPKSLRPKSQGGSFDPSKPLTSGYTEDQKAARLQYLQQKAAQ